MQKRTTKVKSERRHASKNRKDPGSRSVRPIKNERAKASTVDGTNNGVGLHLLGSQLKRMPLMFMSHGTGKDFSNSKSNLLSIIDTEEKQLQAVSDLYQIVKAQPKYKNLKEPVWDVTTAPIEVIYWLLRKLGPLAEGEAWTIDTYKEGRKLRYQFIVYRHYHRQHVKDREEYIPLDFLPFLKNRDQPLHDMIIDLIALVSKANKIPLWDEDGDFSKGMMDLFADRWLATELYSMQFDCYNTGPAAEYLKLIKKRRRVVTERSIQEMLEKYNAKSERKSQMIWWIKKGLSLAKDKQCITTNTYIPHFWTGTPITPYRMYKFVWSLHDKDILRQRAYAIMKKDEKDGEFLPLEFSITRPGQKVKPIKHDRFPIRLYDFMSHAVAMLFWRYKDYYYRDRLSAPETPSESLMNLILIDELRTTGRIEVTL
jgi:hypothetical protein